MTGLEALIGLVVAATAVVFGLGFRFGLTQVRQPSSGVPRAVVASGDPRWIAGQGRQRWLSRIPSFQAALVALGITSIFLMVLCFAAIVVVVIIGS